MYRFVHGKRLKNEVAHHRSKIQWMHWMRLVFYGYPIMLYHDVVVVIRNFGLAGESIIVGKLSQKSNKLYLLSKLAICLHITSNFNIQFQYQFQIVWSNFLCWLLRILGTITRWTFIYTCAIVWTMLSCNYNKKLWTKFIIINSCIDDVFIKSCPKFEFTLS